jgi:hypothetical protein
MRVRYVGVCGEMNSQVASVGAEACGDGEIEMSYRVSQVLASRRRAMYSFENEERRAEWHRCHHIDAKRRNQL